MRIRTRWNLFAGVLAAALACSAAFAAPPEITIEPLACVPSTEKNTNAKVVVTVNSAFTPASVRLYYVAEGALMYHEAHGKIREQEKDAFYRDAKGQNYFHPDHHTGFRFHEMVRSADGKSYWAMLPKAAPGTTDVYFHAEVLDAGGREYLSRDVRVPVTEACPTPELSREEKKYAENLVVGLTAERQTAVPPGFLCDGIVSFLTPAGDLKDNEECRKCSCGIAPVWWVAGGAAALAGGGVVIENQRGHAHHHPVSSARP